MVLMFEVAGPFRWKPKVERVGALTRIIWGCFSVARIAAGFNDISRTFREDEREHCAAVCEAKANENADKWEGDEAKAASWMMLQCAAAIMTRSNA